MNEVLSVIDDQIGGYTMPKGSIVFMLPYVVHRHPELVLRLAHQRLRHHSAQHVGQ